MWFFFFQAEDGIRDLTVTGVQTCALPIYPGVGHNERFEFLGDAVLGLAVTEFLFATYPDYPEGELAKIRAASVSGTELSARSEERRVGKAGRSGGAADQQTANVHHTRVAG